MQSKICDLHFIIYLFIFIIWPGPIQQCLRAHAQKGGQHYADQVAWQYITVNS